MSDDRCPQCLIDAYTSPEVIRKLNSISEHLSLAGAIFDSLAAKYVKHDELTARCCNVGMALFLSLNEIDLITALIVEEKI